MSPYAQVPDGLPCVLSVGSTDDSASVLVAMSGGVDSSVAALLLRQSGFRVVGVTLKLFDEDTMAEDGGAIVNPKACCTLEDVEDAKQVARSLGFPHYTFNFKRVFGTTVIDRFCRGYLQGETPNPCIDCNRFVKFETLQQRRRELGLDFVATGHYARRSFDPASGRYLLRTGLDPTKDQSYVLYNLTQDQLAHMLFPLGDLTKPQVRELAEEQGFASAHKQESQDICFVPDGDYAAFIQHEVRRRQAAPEAGAGHDPLAEASTQTLQPGPIVDGNGTVLGQHEGIARYTIGQRKGLGIAAAQPLFVCAKYADTNTLVVGTADEARTDRIVVHDVNLISRDEITAPVRVKVKTHYRQIPQPALLQPLTSSPSQDGVRLEVIFDEPQRGCAPGQAAVFYEDDIVVGGGTIGRY